MQSSHFFAQLARMNLINRWSLMRNVFNENIAEHSLQVAMVAHMMAIIENKKFGGKLDPNQVAIAAMYHDVSEVFTGDLPTPVKYQNENIASEYKQLEKMAEAKLVRMLPEEFRQDFERLIISDCVDPNVHRIVKDADTMCAYIKCKCEIKAHNSEFDNAADRLYQQLQKRKENSPAISYFEEIFLESFTKTLDEISF